MHPIPAPWTTWWQHDLPCRFSPEDATRNAAFLKDMLGEAWLGKATQPLSTHPLIREWMTNGANAFLQMNALAEDARLLTSVPGFGQVLRDLKESGQCLSSWHVIRAAAIFQRGGASVSQFYDQNDERVPDFLVSVNSLEVNIEAKLLLISELEETFHEYANLLREKVFAEAMPAKSIYPPITIVVKEVTVLPEHSEVVGAVSTLLSNPQILPNEYRSTRFNVFLDAPPPGKGLFRSCYVLCRRSDKENLRVATRIRNASRQLLSERGAGHPGIFWLGITEHQDARFLGTLLLRKFGNGDHAGVSQAYLVLSGTHLQPPRRTVVDYGARFVNPKSRNPLPIEIPLKSLDLRGDLNALQSSEFGIPAYRVGAAETAAEPGMPQLWLPDLRRVDEQSLK